MRAGTTINGLHPRARLLDYALRAPAHKYVRVAVPGSELQRATGWANRTSLRKRTHDLINAGVLVAKPTALPNGGQGPNGYVLHGDDRR